MAWVPSKLPKIADSEEGASAVAQWLEDDLQRLSSSLAEDNKVKELVVNFVAPVRPRPGMLVYADGTRWNPGSGEGLYVRTIAGAWSKCN